MKIVVHTEACVKTRGAQKKVLSIQCNIFLITANLVSLSLLVLYLLYQPEQYVNNDLDLTLSFIKDLSQLSF